jgi:pimeloyl-ACP methyl ester carboxylesterase
MSVRMSASEYPYKKPISCWPELAPYARRVTLPNGLNLHVYDSRPDPGLADDSLPPILLVHGLGDDADTWRYVFVPLAAGRRVIALDLPGFARSDPAPGAYRLPLTKGFLLDLLDVLDIPRATLVGHSLGAMLCQYLSFENPERVERLIVLSGSVVSRFQKVDRALLLYLLPVIGEWQYNHLRKDPQKAYETLRPYYADLDSLPQSEREFLFERVNQRVWSDSQRVAFLATIRNLASWAPSRRGDLEDKLAGSTVPTLMIWGDQDAINSLDNGRLSVQLQPAIRLTVLHRAGHNLMQEQPQALVETILGFLTAEE